MAPRAKTSGRAASQKLPNAAARGRADEGDVVLASELREVVGYLLRRTHNLFQTYWMQEFREPDVQITPVQAGMLVVVDRNSGLTQTALAKIMNVEGPTLLQSVDRLEQNGYVRRVRRPNDRRSYALELTERGGEVLKSVRAFVARRDAELMADLSIRDRAQLRELLTRIIEGAAARAGSSAAGAGEEPDINPAPRGSGSPRPPRAKKQEQS